MPGLAAGPRGGFVNDPRDSGGITNKGITGRVYGQWLADTMDVDTEVTEEVSGTYLTATSSRSIVNRDQVAGDKLPAELDWAVFDWAVNKGSGDQLAPCRRSLASQLMAA